jgi:hypothetical protein
MALEELDFIENTINPMYEGDFEVLDYCSDSDCDSEYAGGLACQFPPNTHLLYQIPCHPSVSSVEPRNVCLVRTQVDQDHPPVLPAGADANRGGSIRE